jgi:ribonuclease E
MSDPAKFDDDWAELARELERDKPAPAPLHPERTSPHAQPFVEEEDRSESLDEQAGDEFEDTPEGNDDSPEGEAGGESDSETSSDAGTGDGPPGTGRKRRRRRRRRRKTGAAQAAGAEATEETEAEAPEGEEAESEDTPFELVPSTGQVESGEGEFGDEPGDEVMDDPIEISAAEQEEDAGGELLRELIANWNVPSWDDVVGGLYRPER